LIRSHILGNEVCENRNRYSKTHQSVLLRYSQCLWKHKNNTAKAIADKIDFGTIVLPVTETDLKNLESLTSTNAMPTPTLVHHVFKNRRGRFKSVKLWCVEDLGTCRVNPIFATDNNYKLIPLDNFNIVVEED